MAKKLQLKAGQAVLVLNAPVGYVESLRPQHDGDIADHAAGEVDVAQLFVMNNAELSQQGPVATRSLRLGGNLWLSYPKKSSGVKTDLARDDGGWASVGETG
jgi:hypothetical protein